MSSDPGDVDCVDLVEMITAYDDGALAPDERARIDAHLAACDGCTEYVRQMRLIPDAIRSTAVEQLPQPMRSRLVEAFRAWKSENT